MTPETPNQEEIQGRFQRLIRELMRGEIKRNTFQPWEVELLLDIEGCNLRAGSKESTLRRYEKAVLRQLDRGAAAPMKLSEFLARKS